MVSWLTDRVCYFLGNSEVSQSFLFSSKCDILHPVCICFSMHTFQIKWNLISMKGFALFNRCWKVTHVISQYLPAFCFLSCTVRFVRMECLVRLAKVLWRLPLTGRHTFLWRHKLCSPKVFAHTFHKAVDQIWSYPVRVGASPGRHKHASCQTGMDNRNGYDFL